MKYVLREFRDPAGIVVIGSVISEVSEDNIEPWPIEENVFLVKFDDDHEALIHNGYIYDSREEAEAGRDTFHAKMSELYRSAAYLMEIRNAVSL